MVNKYVLAVVVTMKLKHWLEIHSTSTKLNNLKCIEIGAHIHRTSKNTLDMSISGIRYHTSNDKF